MAASGQSRAASLASSKAKGGTENDGSALRGENEKKRASASDPTAGPHIVVTDLRKAAARKSELSDKARSEKAEAAAGAANPSSDASREAGRESSRELFVDLGRGSGSARSDFPGDAGGSRETAGAPSSDFSALLAEKLRDSYNGEIVKTAHIVLKDGDSGSIRLRLNPESLGSVKIELNLSDNHISGKIVVESDEAKNAFEKSMADLRDAFAEGGFETASFEVLVGQGGGGQEGGRNGAFADSNEPFWSERRSAEAFGSSLTKADAPIRGSRDGAVDILA